MLESFKTDLSHLQSNPPEGKKAKAKDLEEHRTRAEYLHHEVTAALTRELVLDTSVKNTPHRLILVSSPLRFAATRPTSKYWRPGRA